MSIWKDKWRVKKLREYCAQGLSAGQIAAYLGTSRNAIISASRRYGAPLKGKPYQPAEKCLHNQTWIKTETCVHGVERTYRKCHACNKTLERHAPCETCAMLAARRRESYRRHRPVGGVQRRVHDRMNSREMQIAAAQASPPSISDIEPLSSPIRGVVDSVMAREPDQCCFPIGDPKADPDFRFCLHPVTAIVVRGKPQRSSYCADHHHHCNEPAE